MNHIPELFMTAEKNIRPMSQNVSSLRTDINEKIAHLHQHQNTISELTNAENLKNIRTIYEGKKGYLNHAIEWFVKQSLWMKILLGTVGIAIGVVFSISIVVSLSLYLVIVFLCEDHFKRTQERSDVIFTQLRTLQQSLAHSIDHINAIMANLVTQLASLGELCHQMADINTNLLEQNYDMNARLKHFEAVIQSLEESKSDFIATNNELKHKLEILYSQLNDQTNAMHESAESINQVDIELGKTCEGFGKSMAKIDQSCHTHEALAAEYERLISLLRAQIQEYKQALQAIPKGQSQENTEDICANSQKVIDNARQALNGQSKAINCHVESSEETENVCSM